MKCLACYPSRMREYSESTGLSYLVVNPLEHRRRHSVDIVGHLYLLGECGHLGGKLLAGHDIGAVVPYCTNLFVLADFLYRYILDKRVNAVFAAEINRMRIDLKAVYRREMHLLAGHEIELCRDIFKCLYSSERRIIAVVVGYGKKIIAAGAIGCGNILGVMRSVGKIRVHMQVAHKRINSDKVVGDCINAERKALLVPVGSLALNADTVLALIREKHFNIKPVLRVCGNVNFFSECGSRSILYISPVEPCHHSLAHTARRKKVSAAERSNMNSAFLAGLYNLREHIISPKLTSSDKICHFIFSFAEKFHQLIIA